jgi:hypothetical protein
MKFIKPTPITDAMLTSSTAPETPPAAYNAGTTYADGATASTGTVGGVITVWESLQNANTGNTPASSPTWWAQIGTTYAVYAAAVTYAAGDIVLSATTHRLYESQVSGNVGNALTDATKWIDIGPTNRWAMFDQVVGTVTSQATPLTVVLEPGIINALALLDISATSVQVTLKNAGGTVTYYEKTYTPEDGRITFGWYEYFFEPLSPQTTLIVSNLPAVGGVLTVTINAPTTAQCGSLVVGRMTEIGDTLRSPSIGIIDYSIKSTDDFGATSVTERAYAKKIEADFLLETRRVDFVAAQLAAVRATPVVWIADDAEIIDSLIAYGFFLDWGIDISYPTHCEASITIEGLT